MTTTTTTSFYIKVLGEAYSCSDSDFIITDHFGRLKLELNFFESLDHLV